MRSDNPVEVIGNCYYMQYYAVRKRTASPVASRANAGIVWECLWPPSQGDMKGVRKAWTPQVVSRWRGEVQTTAHLISHQTARSQGVARGHMMGTGEGWPWQGKWDRSKDQVYALVVLLRADPDLRHWKFTFPLTFQKWRRRKNILSCSPGS